MSLFGIHYEQHYDKLLHIAVTFTVLSFLLKFASMWQAISIMFLLQCLKVVSNKHQSPDYTMPGDWLANVGGYLVVLLYHVI